MRKKLTKAAVLACSLALSLAPMSAAAAPEMRQRMETSAGEGLQDGLDAEDEEDTCATEDTVDDAEDTTDTAGTDAEADGTGGADRQEEPAGTDVTADTGQNRITAEQIKAEKAGTTETTKAALNNEDDEDEEGAADVGEEEDMPTYTAPEDTRHANVSFAFKEAATSPYFSKLTYPLTLGLKEVDTGRRLSLTIKSEGQILEVGKGDYAVTSLKDSGKIPLSVAGDTLHVYENTEYPVRFAANNALKMLMDFIADNVFLGVFLVFTAIFYKKAIIPRFASDARRR